MKLNYLALLLAGCLLLFLSCQKDSEKDSKDHTIVNDSWVTIISPRITSTTPEAANVSLLIAYASSTGNLLKVRAKVFPKNDRNNLVYNVKEELGDDAHFSISSILNLSNFPLGTVFTIIGESDQNKSGTVVAKDSSDFTIR
jgi:hypothetical protein